MSTPDHEQKPNETDEAPEVKELTDDELADVAGGSIGHDMSQRPGSGT
jgi:hypothetical protein